MARRDRRTFSDDAIAGTFSDDFFSEGRRQPSEQERPALDTLFD